MKITKLKMLIWLLFIVIGMLLFCVDTQAAIIYITVFPFHVIMFMHAIKKKNLMMTVIMGLLLVSQGVNSVLFFYNRDKYSSVGYKAIGSFSFELGEFFGAYLYVFVFTVVVYLIFQLASPRDDTIFNFIYDFVNGATKKKLSLAKTSPQSTIVLAITTVLGALLAYYMFSIKIGIVGLPQTELPFHLTGILYYFRLYLLNFLLLYLYLKSSNKGVASLLIMMYTFVAGFSSVSRSLIAITLLFIVAESVLSKHYKRAVFVLVFYMFMFVCVTKARNLVYVGDISNFWGYVYESIQLMSDLEDNFVLYFIDEISTRLYGAHCVILASQYTSESYLDLLHYYLGDSISEIVPNMMLNLFGMVAPEGMAVGVSLGYIGQMVLLSNHSLVGVVIQAILIAVILLIMERSLTKSMITAQKVYYKIMLIIIACANVLLLWFGLSMIFTYALTALVWWLANIKFSIK